MLSPMKEPQRLTTEAFWDDLWSAAADEQNERAGYYDRVLVEILDRVFAGAAKGETCLEVGCGNSRHLPLVAIRYGLAVAGLDYTEIGCRTAREHLQHAGVEAPVYQRDLFDPNDDLQERFDHVISFGLIEHFEDPVAVLKVMRRFLKPSGRIMTLIPNLAPGSLNVRVFRMVGPRILAMHKLMTLDELRRYHEQAGFATLDCRFAGVGICTKVDGRSVSRRLLQQAVFRATQAVRKMCEWLRCEPPQNSFTAVHMVYHGRQ
jgi:2-polyprenyl-3-methyl-5-hydroxy-6-metoxy-1,4-benzoquinol methylase